MTVKSSKMYNETKLLIFMTLMSKISQFSKIEIFGPPKNSYVPNFSWILIIFSTEISQSGTDISISIINHLLELGRCFPTLYEQIL